MKKVVIGLSLLVAVCGLVMAGTTKTTKTKTEQTTTKEKTCSNCGKVIYYGTTCSDCTKKMNEMCTPTENGKQTEWQKSNCN